MFTSTQGVLDTCRISCVLNICRISGLIAIFHASEVWYKNGCQWFFPRFLSDVDVNPRGNKTTTINPPPFWVNVDTILMPGQDVRVCPSFCCVLCHFLPHTHTHTHTHNLAAFYVSFELPASDPPSSSILRKLVLVFSSSPPNLSCVFCTESCVSPSPSPPNLNCVFCTESCVSPLNHWQPLLEPASQWISHLYPPTVVPP